jgi:hypothetical protein
MCSYYVITTERDGKVAPYFFDTVWSPDLPLFSLHEALVPVSGFESQYSVVANTQDLNVDVLLNDYLASSRFLRLCDDLAIHYFSVPVKVFLLGGESPKREFVFFCVMDRYFILDNERSVYKLADPGLSKRDVLPVYERIEKFVVKKNFTQHLFYCEEIKKMVCSARFKVEFESRFLVGASFTLIDDSYVFSPWDDF